jgi:hypothetical protein
VSGTATNGAAHTKRGTAAPSNDFTNSTEVDPMTVTNADSSTSSTTPSPPNRGVWFAVIMALSLMAAMIAGLIAALLKANGMQIMGTGGSVFASVIGLGMAAHHFLRA